MRFHVSTQPVLWLGLLYGLTASLPASATNEAVSFGVVEFGGTGECGGDNRNYAGDMVDAFDDVFDGWQSSGYWDESLVKKNLLVDFEDFADSTLATGGADEVENAGVDSADVGYLVTHGASTCDSSDGYYVDMSMGDSSQACTVTAGEDGIYDDVLLGNPGNDGDLEIMIVEACQSAQYCVFEHSGFNDVDGSELLMWAGFHGDNHIGTGTVDEIEDYAAGSRLTGVGANWLSERYDDRGRLADQCPTAMVWGSSATADNIMYYVGGLDNWIDTGTHTVLNYYYVCDCNPGSGLPISCD